MAPKKARKAADAIDLTEMARPQEKKQKVALTTIAKEFVCPITQELPIQPVTAEDGKIYEETAIRDWFSKKDGDPTSPSTGAVIGTKLLPAPQARNTIEALVESGAIEGEIAEAWKEKLKIEALVKETRTKAEVFRPILGVLALALMAIALLAWKSEANNDWGVISGETQVRFGPAEQSPDQFKWFDGTEVQISRRHQDWFLARDVTGRQGWVHADVLLTPKG